MERSIRDILYSSHFERAMKKLPRNFLHQVIVIEALFKANCFDERLKTHKLQGRHKNLWSFSITYQHRIIFEFIDDTTVLFLDVGDHSIY